MFRPLGEGDADIGREGYRGWYVLEVEPEEGEGPVTDIRKSLDFLERQLEEVG